MLGRVAVAFGLHPLFQIELKRGDRRCRLAGVRFSQDRCSSAAVSIRSSALSTAGDCSLSVVISTSLFEWGNLARRCPSGSNGHFSRGSRMVRRHASGVGALHAAAQILIRHSFRPGDQQRPLDLRAGRIPPRHPSDDGLSRQAFSLHNCGTLSRPSLRQ